MNKFFKETGVIAVLFGILLTSTTANAILISDTIEQDIKVNWGKSYSFTHDLTDDGFIPGAMTATSGAIKIQFYDDNKGRNDRGFLGAFGETILITIDKFDFDTGGIITTASTFSNELEVKALAQVNIDGTLDVTIQSVFGDFYVGESLLSVHAKSNNAPAPAILAIFSIGLLAISFAGRLRKVRNI